jgi:hypothetical protein
MKYDVAVETAEAELVAAVRAKVPISGIAHAWKPALDQVWAFLKANGGLRPGHNLFLYHHPERRNESMNIDFGVQVAHPFEGKGDVRCVETPAGEVASGLHREHRLIDRKNRHEQSLVCCEQPENRADLVGNLRGLE